MIALLTGACCGAAIGAAWWLALEIGLQSRAWGETFRPQRKRSPQGATVLFSEVAH